MTGPACSTCLGKGVGARAVQHGSPRRALQGVGAHSGARDPGRTTYVRARARIPHFARDAPRSPTTRPVLIRAGMNRRNQALCRLFLFMPASRIAAPAVRAGPSPSPHQGRGGGRLVRARRGAAPDRGAASERGLGAGGDQRAPITRPADVALAAPGRDPLQRVAIGCRRTTPPGTRAPAFERARRKDRVGLVGGDP
jgi:hypothetical protein